MLHRALYRAQAGASELAAEGQWQVRDDAPDDRGATVGPATRGINGCFQDGPNLVTLAMNGWADAEPAWWLNLQAQPDTTVELKDEPSHRPSPRGGGR